jgi:hypothetical protein
MRQIDRRARGEREWTSGLTTPQFNPFIYSFIEHEHQHHQAEGGPGDIPPCTLYDTLASAVKKWGANNALAVKRPKPVRTCGWCIVLRVYIFIYMVCTRVVV